MEESIFIFNERIEFFYLLLKSSANVNFGLIWLMAFQHGLFNAKAIPVEEV